MAGPQIRPEFALQEEWNRLVPYAKACGIPRVRLIKVGREDPTYRQGKLDEMKAALKRGLGEERYEEVTSAVAVAVVRSTPTEKGPPPRKMSEADALEQHRRNSAAIRGGGNTLQAWADIIVKSDDKPAAPVNGFQGPQRPLAPYNITFKGSDGVEIVCKVMAPHWANAFGMAVTLVANEGKLSPDEIPEFSVARG